MIEKITIENFRGFKEKQALELAKPGSITFLVGPNNSGKSNIPRLFLNLFGKATIHPNKIFDGFFDKDFFRKQKDNPIKIGLEFSPELWKHLETKSNFPEKGIKKFDLNFFVRPANKEKKHSIDYWFSINSISSFLINQRGNLSFNPEFESNFNDNEDNTQKRNQELGKLIEKSLLIFESIRSWETSSKTSISETGNSLVKWLNENGTESAGEDLKNKVFQTFKEFGLEAPFNVHGVISDKNRDAYIIYDFDGPFSLEDSDLGTGYNMVFILLAELIRNSKKIILIDEIESHLHPGLIRLLMRKIRELGKNVQFIISTHSPSVLSEFQEGDQLMRFHKEDIQCKITKANPMIGNDSEMGFLKKGLGIIPGDALLTNSIIWVEGPTELLWIRGWLRAFLPHFKKTKGKKSNLIEGMHYSIMLTGGNLIERYKFEDKNHEVEEPDDHYIHVLRVNPNAFGIIDSDQPVANGKKWKRTIRIAEELNKLNQNHSIERFKEEFVNEPISEQNLNSIPNFIRLSGRELENFIHPQLLKEFLENRAKSSGSKINIPQKPEYNVFSTQFQITEILEKNGFKNIPEFSSLKTPLSDFVFDEIAPIHFEDKPKDILPPDPHMLLTLKEHLTKLLEFIYDVNWLD
ncbi:MAG: ATP-binding protein [Bacteroidia bacterium]|nr:ATP-binding protein [Bacteroidia bacterium]